MREQRQRAQLAAHLLLHAVARLILIGRGHEHELDQPAQESGNRRGPLIGLVISMWAKLFGAVVIALTMAASLIFGVVNHFIIDSPDHVSHIAAPWSRLFAITAVLLAITELLGMVVALRLVRVVRPTLTD